VTCHMSNSCTSTTISSTGTTISVTGTVLRVPLWVTETFLIATTDVLVDYTQSPTRKNVTTISSFPYCCRYIPIERQMTLQVPVRLLSSKSISAKLF
jgi:hypothetical protein